MWTKEKIEALLMRNDEAVERALVVLLARQTADERQSEQTKVVNGRGFMSFDAKRMSSMAKQVQRGRPLTERQLFWLRARTRSDRWSRIGKYAKQLAEVANEKAATEATAKRRDQQEAQKERELEELKNQARGA